MDGRFNRIKSRNIKRVSNGPSFSTFQLRYSISCSREEKVKSIALVKIQQMRLVVGVNDKVPTARLVACTREPRSNEIDNLGAKMVAFVVDINAKLCQ